MPIARWLDLESGTLGFRGWLPGPAQTQVVAGPDLGTWEILVRRFNISHSNSEMHN
jgi:hypothetical protein